MKNRHIIHRIGFDFDKCLLPDRLTSPIIVHNDRLLRAIEKQNKYAFWSSNVTLVSNRQSDGIDKLNSKDPITSRADKNRSCFPAVKTIAEKLNNTLCSALAADAYSERPCGYSYTRAIQKYGDDTAHHPGFVFDTYKSSLLLFHAHIAAKQARECDFLSHDSLATQDDLFKIPLQSNAAYVYINGDKKLFYVNKAEKLISELNDYEEKKFKLFLDEINTRIDNEEHDFETLDQKNDLLKGVTLNDSEMDKLSNIAGHRHIVKDYPIIFDFYDDLKPIFDDLKKTFSSKEQRALLPKNMTIRLNLYDANKPDQINPIYAVIHGEGDIDLNPKATIVEMAKRILKKDELDEDDYDKTDDVTSSFSQFILNPSSASFFATRITAQPTVEYQEKDAYYASVHFYDSSLDPIDVYAIHDTISELKDECDSPFTIFPSRKKEKISELSSLLNFSKSHDKAEVFNKISDASAKSKQGFFSQRTRNLLRYLEDKLHQELNPDTTRNKNASMLFPRQLY